MGKERIAGIDVGCDELVVAIDDGGGRLTRCEYPNDADGHSKLVRALSKGGGFARVCLEATGVYALEVARALHRAERIEVMVVNPRAMRDFAKACLARSKTDVLDADVLMEFVRRMPFVPWQPPTPEILEIQAIPHRIAAPTKMRTQELSRLHACRRAGEPALQVCNDIEEHIGDLEDRIAALQRQVIERVRAYEPTRAQLELLLSVTGIAEVSATQILAELCVLPQDMSVRQWVAHAGLDPRTFESRTSVRKRPRISKVGNRYLRVALYMPALVAVQHESHVRAFYDQLLGRGKTKMQANVAVMRELLHMIYGMKKSGQRFNPERFYRVAA